MHQSEIAKVCHEANKAFCELKRRLFTGIMGIRSRQHQAVCNRRLQRSSGMLSIGYLLQQHRTRCARWHAGAAPWSALEWAGCMAGECGEAANAAKKLKRLEDNMNNPDLRDDAPTAEKYKKQIVREIADVMHYGVLFADAIGEGENLEQALRDTFNEKSELNGFPERL